MENINFELSQADLIDLLSDRGLTIYSEQGSVHLTVKKNKVAQ